MNTAGFWISRHASPDEILMTPAAIQNFNAHVRDELKLTRDLFKAETFLPSVSLKNTLEDTNREIQSEKYFDAQGLQPGEKFFKPLLQKADIHKTYGPQYGLVVRFTDERLLPTDDGLYEKPDDVEFDQLQNSGLDIGTPILILHYSQDKQWLYEMNELTEGWIRADNVAIGDLETVQNYAESDAFAIAVRPKTDIFSDPQRTQFIGTIRMGSRLPLKNDKNSPVVLIPGRDDSGALTLKEAYVGSQNIQTDYLPYTARHVYEQAFAMLNTPYGWGDRNAQQDCSRFLQQVFAVFGIKWPRNSKDQAKTGLASAAFDQATTDPQKREALTALGKGVYVLTMKGHIMLYLGHVDGNPYAIHDVYAYREKTPAGDVARVINRVAVTDLKLGDGSQKGSLLRRMTGIREITSQNPSIK